MLKMTELTAFRRLIILSFILLLLMTNCSRRCGGASRHPVCFFIPTKARKADSTGRRNTFDQGGVYGTTSKVDT